MARKTVSLNNIDDAYISTHADMGIDSFDPDSFAYVDISRDCSDFGGILWMEIKRTMKKAKLTMWQAVVLKLYLAGLSTREIAKIYGRKQQTIFEHLNCASKKMQAVPHCGVLTVMIENLGWSSVKEALSDELEAKLKPKHPVT